MKVSFNQIEAVVQIAKQHYEATDMPMEEVANEIILELQKLCQLEPLVIKKNAEGLLPCPFCARLDAEIVEVGNLFTVVCKCGCEAPKDSKSREYIKRIWNRRR